MCKETLQPVAGPIIDSGPDSACVYTGINLKWLHCRAPVPLKSDSGPLRPARLGYIGTGFSNVPAVSVLALV